MGVEGYEKCELGNDLEFVDDLVNNMLLILVEYASDDFWKILKYGSSDALSNPSYTVSLTDKYNMVKQNNFDEDQSELTRIKVLKFQDDISTDAHTELRIFNAKWIVPSTGEYSLLIGFEIISHNKIIVLDGVGKTVLNVIRNEIYKIFNNAYVKKNVGKLTNVGSTGSIKIFNDTFQGYQFYLSSTSG